MKRVSNISFDTARQAERSFKIIGQAASGMATAAAAGLVYMTARAIDAADKIGKMAQSTGMGVEQFSKLAYAAKLSNVSNSQLSQSLVIMSQNLQRANLATEEGRAAHSALGTLFAAERSLFLCSIRALRA
jgi:hypothetical protein